jgi:hypothetical protein
MVLMVLGMKNGKEMNERYGDFTPVRGLLQAEILHWP